MQGCARTGKLGHGVRGPYLSPPRIKAVLRPVNLPSCGERETGSKVRASHLSLLTASQQTLLPHLFSELHGLQSQLPGGREDEGPGPCLCAARFQPLKHREEEAGCFAAACPGHGHHVLAVQDHRDGLSRHTLGGNVSSGLSMADRG